MHEVSLIGRMASSLNAFALRGYGIHHPYWPSQRTVMEYTTLTGPHNSLANDIYYQLAQFQGLGITVMSRSWCDTRPLANPMACPLAFRLDIERPVGFKAVQLKAPASSGCRMPAHPPPPSKDMPVAETESDPHLSIQREQKERHPRIQHSGPRAARAAASCRRGRPISAKRRKPGFRRALSSPPRLAQRGAIIPPSIGRSAARPSRGEGGGVDRPSREIARPSQAEPSGYTSAEAGQSGEGVDG